MFCKNCGKTLNEGEMFCANCGTKVENQTNTINNNVNTTQTMPNINNNVNQSQQIPNQAVFNNQQVNQMNAQYSNNVNNNKSGKSTASLILGIISVVLSLILNIFIIPVAIVGFILALIDKNKSGKKIAGIILNSCGIALPIIILIISGLALESDLDLSKVYYGKGYDIEYNSNWSEVSLTQGAGLEYKYDESYFVPIGTSTLTQFTNYFKCDFSDVSCQTEVYDVFYDNWSSQLTESYLYKTDSQFHILKDDIYYATFDYGKSSTDLRGKYYVLATKDKDVLLSFMSNASVDKVDELNNAVLDLLKGITIYDNTSNNDSSSDNNTLVDDELYDMLDSMRNWNLYSDLRQGNLGKIDNLTGGWRKLEESEEYWVFRDGEFWWYQSVNNLNDNYWYGTTEILTGKEGFAKVGLDESKVDTIFSNSNGKVDLNDIYTVLLTPTKIILGGVDKSSTNIPSGTNWTYVWILVDHGDEGIEGQVLNMQTYYTSYFVKLED